MFRSRYRWLLALLLLLPAVHCEPGRAQGPGARQRLILKDGSYQLVSRYEVRADRVRFLSVERDDGWEDLPAELVDWRATERWNHEHAPGAKPDPDSPAAQEAAELDRQAAAARAAELARSPEVAPGLRLPDESGVWALDSYGNVAQLVQIHQSDGDLNTDTGHTVKAATIPAGGARDLIRLGGYKAAVSFHVARPVFFIALDVPGEASREDALVVDTHGAAAAMGSKTERASPASTYALVRLRVWKNERAASGQELRALANGGEADGSAEVVATERTILPGGRWMRVAPRGDMNLGQYSLVEILPEGGFKGSFNLDGWDFGVNPMAPENKGGFRPVGSGEDGP